MSRSRPSSVRRPRVERLEARHLLAGLTVSSSADDGPGSLRAAIEAADLDTTTPVVEIDFAIGGGGPATIDLRAALPTITRPVFINGSTQSDDAGSPEIVIDGCKTPAGSNGLTIAGGSSTVERVQIRGFAGIASQSSTDGGRGILLTGAGGDLLIGNQVGGFGVGDGNAIGVEVDAADATIGGGAGLGNAISGNGNAGYIDNAFDNVISADVKGTGIQGQRAL